MDRRAFVAAITGGLLGAPLGGCGRYYWRKAGSTAEQFDRDSRACVQGAKSIPPESVPGRAADVIEARYRACLAARGYVRERQSGPPAAGSHRGIESEEELAAGAPSQP